MSRNFSQSASLPPSAGGSEESLYGDQDPITALMSATGGFNASQTGSVLDRFRVTPPLPNLVPSSNTGNASTQFQNEGGKVKHRHRANKLVC